MMTFSDVSIGNGNRCFIIAEAGVNHNGNIDLAYQLVDAAQVAGADAIKFQTWITENLVTPDAQQARYQEVNTGISQSQFAMLKGLELGFDAFRKLKKYAEQKNIMFISSPDEEESADFLESLDVRFYKIGSGELTNTPFLRHIANKKRPIILSTGMASLGEIETAVRSIEETGNQQIIILHCVSEYPVSPKDCNLRAINTLKQAFGYPVGFSDHSMGWHIPIAAVSLGACVIEKHFTLDNNLEGPDHKASLNTEDFQVMVRHIREIEQALGTGLKRMTSGEMETKNVVQKTLVLAKAMKAGDVLQRQDVILRRASAGLQVGFLEHVIGLRLTRDLPINTPLQMDFFK